MSRRAMPRPYAEVIGDPIAHSKSPLIHGFWLARCGIAADYRACHVRDEELAGYFAARRADPAWRGCNVTIPHKQAVARQLDSLDARAAAIGATNTVLRQDGNLQGTNTDVDGVEDAIVGAPPGGVAVVIGAGGAARAAFAVLAGRSETRVRVIARNPQKAQAALEECALEAGVHPFSTAADTLAGASLLINATQLGMAGQAAMPAGVLEGLEALAPDALVFDMVYAPLRTQLLAAAAGRKLRAVDGLTMLIGQAATAFERFFHRPPPRTDDAALRALLTA